MMPFGSVGEDEGFGVGELLGEDEGFGVGELLGEDEGFGVGDNTGTDLIEDGFIDGPREGDEDSEGDIEIDTVGLADGESEEVVAGGARLK